MQKNHQLLSELREGKFDHFIKNDEYLFYNIKELNEKTVDRYIETLFPNIAVFLDQYELKPFDKLMVLGFYSAVYNKIYDHFHSKNSDLEIYVYIKEIEDIVFKQLDALIDQIKDLVYQTSQYNTVYVPSDIDKVLINDFDTDIESINIDNDILVNDMLINTLVYHITACNFIEAVNGNDPDAQDIYTNLAIDGKIRNIPYSLIDSHKLEDFFDNIIASKKMSKQNIFFSSVSNMLGLSHSSEKDKIDYNNLYNVTNISYQQISSKLFPLDKNHIDYLINKSTMKNKTEFLLNLNYYSLDSIYENLENVLMLNSGSLTQKIATSEHLINLFHNDPRQDEIIHSVFDSFYYMNTKNHPVMRFYAHAQNIDDLLSMITKKMASDELNCYKAIIPDFEKDIMDFRNEAAQAHSIYRWIKNSIHQVSCYESLVDDKIDKEDYQKRYIANVAKVVKALDMHLFIDNNLKRGSLSKSFSVKNSFAKGTKKEDRENHEDFSFIENAIKYSKPLLSKKYFSELFDAKLLDSIEVINNAALSFSNVSRSKYYQTFYSSLDNKIKDVKEKKMDSILKYLKKETKQITLDSDFM